MSFSYFIFVFKIAENINTLKELEMERTHSINLMVFTFFF